MTVDEMLRRLTANELSDWERYWEIEPFGQSHQSRTVAILTAVVYNCFRVFSGSKSPTHTEENFIPRYSVPLTKEQEIARDRAFVEELKKRPDLRVVVREAA